ncbi:MAG: putative molybdenum carrier protein [Gemmatimonadota bacterium]
MASHPPDPTFLIVSGGQTGVDRAALDAARTKDLPVTGWIPAGRKAEDGMIPRRYRGLRETRSGASSMRTERNVRDANAVLIVMRGGTSGGTRLALETAQKLGRPMLELDLGTSTEDQAAKALSTWLGSLPRPIRLNIAGPRESESPGIHRTCQRLLERALDGAGHPG